MIDAPPTVTGAIPVTRRTPLTAVVVTRGVTRYLPTTLAALAAQTREVARVVVVDAAPAPRSATGAGRGAGSGEVTRVAGAAFAESATDVHVVPTPGARSFGEAVQGGLVEVEPGEPGGWLWLLHDDSAPAPTALAELVRVVEHAPSVAVAGAKQRGWLDPAQLLELGVTTSRLGRRMTGVEDGEVDQGQHDGREDVLAVGLAGALVRRDVWDELGGTDPSLGPFGDGLDLCRRARLAGHRVVVVPRAVVQHAQASLNGLRDGRHPGDAAGDPPVPDPRRSYAARRRASVHARLAAAPLPLLPLLTVAALVSGFVRALGRVAAKDGVLALAELAAPVVAVLHPARMARSRARARRTRRLPRRSLRPLQSTWRDVVREERDRLLRRGAARRVVRAPSELEIAELAALAGRRRAGLAALVAALAALTVAALGSLVVAVAGGRALVGGGLLPAVGDLGALWRAATSGWVTAGLGTAAPSDPLLTVLLPVTAIAGGEVQTAVHGLFLLSLPVAGLGAWAAAGAATRSVGLRWWAALVWVAAPPLALALDDGRLGAALAHAALPWVALGVARALGVQRTDVVLSGMVGVGEHRHAEPDADRVRGDSAAGSPAADPGATADVDPDDAVAAAAPPAQHAPTAPLSTVRSAGSEAEAGPGPAAPARALGSVTAAAAAGLAFAVAVAGAPVLLPVGLLTLVAVAVAARGGRRRLVLVALPALAVAGPLLADAAERLRAGGWRTLLAEPGLPVPSTPGLSWQGLLGWPVAPTPSFAGLLGDDAASVLPYVLGGTLLGLAALALVRGRDVARGVRVAWVVAALGLAAAVAAGAVETSVADGVVVRGWTGAGISVLVLGLLAAATLGADGTRARVSGSEFGWRQLGAVALAVLAVLAPLTTVAGWLARVHDDVRTPSVAAADEPFVPAVGQQAQTSDARSRVLALTPTPDDGVAYRLLRGDGPQALEGSAAQRARGLTGTTPDADVAEPDDAAAEVEQLVAALASGASGDVAADLAALAVAAVLVPPVSDAALGDAAPATPAAEGSTGSGAEDSTDPAPGSDAPGTSGTSDPEASPTAARAELVGRLDSTAGLERITESSTGVIWRVVSAGTAPSWARLVTPGDGADEGSTSLAAGPLSVRDRIPPGDAARTVVLAERRAPGWTASLDGRRLPDADAGWRQAFTVGPAGGLLTVEYAPPSRTPWLVAQGLVLGLTLLLALPVRRRRGGTR